MTQRLEQAIAEVQKRSPTEQDAIAALILDELADDQRWDESFARSQDRLSELAEKVREDIRAGRVKNVRLMMDCRVVGELSPEGAAVSSQGREPLGNAERPRPLQPQRGDSA